MPIVLSFHEDSSMERMVFSRGSEEGGGLVSSSSSRFQLSSSFVEERSVVVIVDEVERCDFLSIGRLTPVIQAWQLLERVAVQMIALHSSAVGDVTFAMA